MIHFKNANFPNKYNEESIQHPINYLLRAIEDIKKLHEAHKCANTKRFRE